MPAVHGAGRGQAYVGGLPRNGGKDRIAPERVRAVGAVGADLVFQRLGVRVEQVLYDNATALQKLKNGELAALVRVIGRPFLCQDRGNSGLHFVPIPFSNTFADYYTLGELTNKEYPTLIPQGRPVDTLAVPAVLAVFNWQKRTDRYRRVRRFVGRLFTNWDKFHITILWTRRNRSL